MNGPERAPEGFAIRRHEPKDNPFDLVEYTIEVTTRIKIAVTAEADANEPYRLASIDYGLKKLADTTIRLCGAVL